MGRKVWYAILTQVAAAVCLFVPGAQPLVPYIEAIGGILIGAHALTDIKLSQHDPKKAK